MIAREMWCINGDFASNRILPGQTRTLSGAGKKKIFYEKPFIFRVLDEWVLQERLLTILCFWPLIAFPANHRNNLLCNHQFCAQYMPIFFQGNEVHPYGEFKSLSEVHYSICLQQVILPNQHLSAEI